MKFELVPIVAIDSIDVNNETVYDLQVEKNHSYCVDTNIIVHNSVCETRKVTGVGYPQLSAISNCANAAHNLRGLICADGGCKEVGDICKAFCAGADFVMLGGMLAGTEECDGEWVARIHSAISGKQSGTYLKFYGMSSREAMENHGGSEKEYRASEGKCIEVPYKGPVDDTVKEILGGLRSCGTYIGAMQIKHFPKHANFVRIK